MTQKLHRRSESHCQVRMSLSGQDVRSERHSQVRMSGQDVTVRSDTHRQAVHGQAGHAVQEVGQCEVDDEDGGVLEGGDVEPEHLVVLRPGDSTESEKVAGRSHNGDDDTARIVMRDSHSLVVLRHPRHCGDAPGEGVVRLLQAAGVHCIFLVGRSRQH